MAKQTDKMVRGIRWDGKSVRMVYDSTGIPVNRGDVVNGLRVSGGAAPHKESSSGRVFTSGGEYFPGVIGARWEVEVAS